MGSRAPRGYGPGMLLREDGQILPGLAVLLAVTLALGVLFFQVGKASILRSDAQNAADAAALAGAQEIQRQLEAQYALTGFTDPTVIERAGRRSRRCASTRTRTTASWSSRTSTCSPST